MKSQQAPVLLKMKGKRGEMWNQLIGTDLVPIRYSKAKRILLASGAVKPCYVLDTSRLSEPQVMRVIGHLERFYKIPYEEAKEYVHILPLKKDGLAEVRQPIQTS